jgi:hypothetical protein
MRSHYELLEVAPDADAAVIKAAYRKLSRTLHPDMPNGSRALFGMVTEAAGHFCTGEPIAERSSPSVQRPLQPASPNFAFRWA